MNVRTEVKVWTLAIIMVVGLVVTMMTIQSKADDATCASALTSKYEHATSCAEYWRERGITVQ